MRVSFNDDFTLAVESTDKDLLEVVKGYADGYKIRSQDRIIIPIKSGPKLLNFDNYGIKFANSGVENAVKIVQFNFEKRKENIKKIKSQYGHEIKFDYDIKGIYSPLDHQKIMFNMIVYNSCAAILAEPGTCKTGAYLWAIDKRIQKQQVKKCLIITLNSLKKNIVEEASVQVPSLKCVILDGKAQADKILNKKFSIDKKNIDYDIYISNYESAFSVCDLFDENYFDMVVLDEAHRVGSYRSRQTKTIIDKFENAKYKYIVTGTLNSNNSLSFFMPYRFLGADVVPQASFYVFRKKNFITVDPDGYIWKEMSGTKQVIKNIINDVGVFFAKKDCLDLPDVIYQKYGCNIEGEHKSVYENMRKNLLATLTNMCANCTGATKDKCAKCDKTMSAKNVLTCIIKLQQMACGFYLNTTIKVDDNGSETKEQNIIDFPDNEKLRLLIMTLGNIPDDKKVIIWSHLTHSIDIICDAIEKSGYGESLKIYKDVDAFDQVEKFKLDKYKYLVANPSKASAGLNIQFSDYQVFFSNNYSNIQREQAIGRQHRKGQKNNVTVIDLFCRNTIDETILQSLANKQDLSEELVSLAKIKKLFT